MFRFSLLKITKLINAYSPFSSMGTIRARFRGRTALPLPINLCGKVSKSVLHRNNYLTYFDEGNEWFEGGNNQYPTSISAVSSFDALDAAIAYTADKKRFPMIKYVVLAGHSAGGQSRRVVPFESRCLIEFCSRSTIRNSRQKSSTRNHSTICRRQCWFLCVFFPNALQTSTT